MLRFLAVIKSGGDPLVNIAGAYFPAWLACMIIGVLGTWLIHLIFSRLKIPNTLNPPVIMIPALFSAITLWSWFLYFASR